MAKDPSRKMTRAEKSWIMYDWANSVYATNIMAAIFPIYFAATCKSAGVSGDAWWGYGTSIATAIVAVLAPLLGAVGDYKGYKKKMLTFFLILGVGFTSFMAIFDNWQMMLIGYVISYIGFAGSNLFYDSFLTDVTTDDRMDRVSAWGYAMGYVGGSTIPFLISIGVLVIRGMSDPFAIKFSVVITSVWWLIFSLPILINVKQTHYIEKGEGSAVKNTFKNIGRTFLDIVRNKAIFIYIIAYFFYIDGVGTVIHMATSYGSTIGLGTIGMILALLVTQLVAAPCSVLFSKLSQKVGSLKMIGSAIVIYIVICCVGFYMGYSLELKQIPFEAGYNAAISETLEAKPEFESSQSETILASVFEGDEVEPGLLSKTLDLLPSSDRAATFGTTVDEVLAQELAFTSEADKAAFISYVESFRAAVLDFINNTENTQPYDDAIAFSSALFWAMAVLVGTVQGGIQALSRSFFGKLIPPEKSNEFFGFFDIFGKFACVIGPFLYALVRSETGRPSLGILSLVVLFIFGGLTLLLGRKTLKKAVAINEMASSAAIAPVEEAPAEEAPAEDTPAE